MDNIGTNLEVRSMFFVFVLIRMAPGPEDAGYELESAVTRHARTSPCLSHHWSAAVSHNPGAGAAASLSAHTSLAPTTGSLSVVVFTILAPVQVGGMEDGGHRILLIRSGRLLEVVAVPGACDHQRTTEEKAGSISSGRGRGGWCRQRPPPPEDLCEAEVSPAAAALWRLHHHSALHQSAGADLPPLLSYNDICNVCCLHWLHSLWKMYKLLYHLINLNYKYLQIRQNSWE